MGLGGYPTFIPTPVGRRPQLRSMRRSPVDRGENGAPDYLRRAILMVVDINCYCALVRPVRTTCARSAGLSM
jgi:hypothetical protein